MKKSNEINFADLIIDLYKHPSNKGKIKNADLIIESGNPLCGDKVKFFILFKGEKIKDIKFQAQGCSISNASASLLSEAIKGKTIKQVLSLNANNVFNLFKAKIVSRISCMLLPLDALKKGLKEFEEKKRKHGLRVKV